MDVGDTQPFYPPGQAEFVERNVVTEELLYTVFMVF